MYKIKTKDGSIVSLTLRQLLGELLAASYNAKEDHLQISNGLAEYLEVSGLLKTTSIIGLLKIAFTLGYFYRIFLTNNDVTIENQDDTMSTETNV